MKAKKFYCEMYNVDIPLLDQEWDIDDVFTFAEAYAEAAIEERMPDEYERRKKEEAAATKRKWVELDIKFTELLDKYFAEHTREEIEAELHKYDTPHWYDGIKKLFLSLQRY